MYGGGQMRTYRGVGFKSQITRIPNQNFGVAVLSNDGSFGTQISETIKFRIIDEALSLERIDWTARYSPLPLSPLPTPAISPSHSRPCHLDSIAFSNELRQRFLDVIKSSPTLHRILPIWASWRCKSHSSSGLWLPLSSGISGGRAKAAHTPQDSRHSKMAQDSSFKTQNASRPIKMSGYY
ncbi:hypothetical protein B0H14DRAFT_2585419 [Mycena olivaceomarginata]|nr:hypothetical protein B0H14DRAFT_2585419 [Mycena olivaceomarginata]